MTSTTDQSPSYTVPGTSLDTAGELLPAMQRSLDELNELALTLKHVHWNVVGPHFIGVHTMIDPQVDAVRLMADAVAERMAALGASPDGRVRGIVERRQHTEYPLGRDDALQHLKELDKVYTHVVECHREAIARTEGDIATQDLFIGQTRDLEQFQWFVRAHAETASGKLG